MLQVEIDFGVLVDAPGLSGITVCPCMGATGSGCPPTKTEGLGTKAEFAKEVLSEPLMFCLVAPSLDTSNSWQRGETDKAPLSSMVVEKRPLPGHMDPGSS